ncbi:MAG: 1-(5-phosphoribosyl)-5-((5-phosphoribosylamino)methylideneamino) imidazole-4-carboxamide isomerase [Bacteroidetes bacterium]|nr:1-(5-phosphoribosyl)-5-((5-phosphoribosylamino)methylideneamino) imidazole-4-carboxamide isomerase [Bacteroidota bacterium]
MHIIPAIDIIDGKCVRLTQGDYAQKTVYSDSPLEIAKQFEGAGITRLHVVDLDGAKSHHVVNHKILEAIASHTSLQVDFGGGIKSDADISTAFDCGAAQVTVGSIAVKDCELTLSWLSKYGSEKIILGADVRDGMIAINGWRESGNIPLNTFLTDYMSAGMRYVICTDIARDGMLSGPAIELYGSIIKKFPNIKLIASGGISDAGDLGKLSEAGLYGAITGKAIYEGKISLAQLKKLTHAG